jgi:2'-5' RNA ligase
MIYNINRKFDVGKRKHVPHITLVGPMTTNNEQRLINDFLRICSRTELMKFKGNGFGTFDSNNVVFVNIGASERLNEFRINLVNILHPYCNLQFQDKKKEIDKFGYHSTLAMNLDKKEFTSIKNYIKNKPAPRFTQIVMRVTLLRNGRILREYDFLQRKLLNRRQALNKNITKRSKILLKDFIQGKYNPNNKIKLAHPTKKESFMRKIKIFFGLKW